VEVYSLHLLMVSLVLWLFVVAMFRATGVWT
jgi:hypothetical protein